MCLDRTNWKFGKNHINDLVLSWRISQEISLPLLCVDLDKAGISNTQERIDLLCVFHQIFGFKRIKFFAADREFVGQKWFEMLLQNKIPFVIRVKENMALSWGERKGILAKKLFSHLNSGEQRRVEKEMWGDGLFFGHAEPCGRTFNCHDKSEC